MLERLTTSHDLAHAHMLHRCTEERDDGVHVEMLELDWNHVECFWERDIMLNGYRIQRVTRCKDNDDGRGERDKGEAAWSEYEERPGEKLARGGGGKRIDRAHGARAEPGRKQLMLCPWASRAKTSAHGHHVGELGGALLPGTGLETAVRVDPDRVLGEDLGHGLDAADHLVLAGDTGRVDVKDTGANVRGVADLLEGAEEVLAGLGVLDRDHVGVELDDRLHDERKVRVAEVRGDVHGVAAARGRETERVDGPSEVAGPVLLAERQTLTDGGLVDLDGADTGLLEVDDLVAEGEGDLLGLNLLADVGTGEGPVEDGDGAGEHALHGLLGEALGVRRPADGHGRRAADVRDDDGGADVARAERLDPGVLGEDEAVEQFAEVLHHVVTLGLAVDEHVEGDLRARSSGLMLATRSRTAGVRVLLKVAAGLDALRVGGEGVSGGAGVAEGGGEGGDLGALLVGKREPVEDLGAELLLVGDGDGGVEERRRRGDLDAAGVAAESLDGLLGGLESGAQVRLPDVAARDETERDDVLGVGKSGEDVLELLGGTVEVDVETGDGERLDDLEVGLELVEVGRDHDLDRGGGLGDGLVGGLELGGVLLGAVEDEDGLVDLDPLGASLGELGEHLTVDGSELLEERDGVELGVLGVLARLAEGEQGDGADEDGTGSVAGLLGLEEVVDGLGVVDLELGRLAQLGDEVVVVRVEPLLHLGGGEVDAVLLVATGHGEVGVKSIEAGAGVLLGDEVEGVGGVEDVVVEREGTGGDNVDAGVLDELVGLETLLLGNLEELLLGGLATPVGLKSLLDLTLRANAGVTEDGGSTVVCAQNGSDGQQDGRQWPNTQLERPRGKRSPS
ncbi:hypothetical protein L1887_52028 [Cichorium endivia]|nr:hypothetical protein L1887_52028 [Cichorium endivia]